MTFSALLRSTLPGLPVLGLLAAAPGAGATTLTTSFAAWQAGVSGTSYTRTNDTGLFDPLALDLPTTGSVVLGDGNILRFSTPAQVTQPQNGFPYLLAGGSSPDLLIPIDGSGNQVRSETISFGGISALGFSVVPFSSSQNGPYTVTALLADGQSVSTSLPGGSFNSGSTVPGFLGFFGGGVTQLVISTSDPNGFGFGAFVDVPEPAAITLLGLPCALVLLSRRTRTPLQA